MHRFCECGQSPDLKIREADGAVALEGPSLTKNLPVWMAPCIPEAMGQGPPCRQARVFLSICSRPPAVHTSEPSCGQVCFGKLLKQGLLAMTALATEEFQGRFLRTPCLSSGRVPRACPGTLGNCGTSDCRGTQLGHLLPGVAGLSPLVLWERSGCIFCTKDPGQKCCPLTGLNASY